MVRLVALLLLAVAGCGPTAEFETLFLSTDGQFTCSNGNSLSTTEEERTVMRECFGLRTSCSTGLMAGAAECATSPMLDGIRGTCVEDFFGCFQPSGGCSTSGNGVAYDNGARVEKNLNSTEDSAYFPNFGNEACIVEQLLPDFGVAPTQFLRLR